jgi:hypothetical protein
LKPHVSATISRDPLILIQDDARIRRYALIPVALIILILILSRLLLRAGYLRRRAITFRHIIAEQAKVSRLEDHRGGDRRG